MIDYTVKMVSLSGRVKGFSTRGIDGDYVIFINQNLSYEQQRKAFEHELKHIMNGDLDDATRSVAVIENETHDCVQKDNNIMDNNTKGKNIKTARLNANMTLEELGKEVGVSKATVQRYETGEIKHIPYENVVKIAEATGTSAVSIIGWNVPKETNKKGDNIRKARKQAGLTLEELGEKIGVTKSTVRKYEIGEISNIPSDIIEKIAEATGTSRTAIMGWDDSKELDAVLRDKNLVDMIGNFQQLSEHDQHLITAMIDSLLKKK